MKDQNSELINVKFPFSLYDVFGYLIPGAMFIVSSYFLESIVFKYYECNLRIHYPIHRFFEETYPSNVIDNLSISLIYLFFLTIFAYVIGHIIASFSSLFNDRILVRKGIGYPYETLLQIKNSAANPHSRNFYRGLYFWSDLIMISYYLFFINFSKLKSNLILFDIIAFILICVSIWIVLVIIGKICYSFIIRRNKAKRPFLEKVFAIFSKPTGIFSNTISEYLNTKKPFDKEFIEKYKIYYNETFNLSWESSNTNNFWLPYIYIVNKSPIMSNLASNWFHMYSFSRNLSTAFYFSFLYCILYLSFQYSEITKICFLIKLYPISLLLISLLLLIRFYFLYYGYFSRFVFRSFIFLKGTEEK